MKSRLIHDRPLPVMLSGRRAGILTCGISEIPTSKIDFMLPRTSGIEVVGRIRECSDIPVIMLTAKGDDVERTVGIELGLNYYLAKPYFQREVIVWLRTVLRRHGARRDAPVSQLTYGPVRTDKRARAAAVDGRPNDLTFAEFSLLLLLPVEAQGHITSKGDISLLVLDRQLKSFDRSVEVLSNNFLQKLACCPPIAFETVRRVGYRLTVH